MNQSAPADIPARFFMPSTLWLNQFSGSSNPQAAVLADTNAPPNAMDWASPASDLLVVTPEMLFDYFRSVPAGTNAANVMVLVPMDFTPAFPPGAPSSSATYRTP